MLMLKERFHEPRAWAADEMCLDRFCLRLTAAAVKRKCMHVYWFVCARMGVRLYSMQCSRPTAPVAAISSLFNVVPLSKMKSNTAHRHFCHFYMPASVSRVTRWLGFIFSRVLHSVRGLNSRWNWHKRNFVGFCFGFGFGFVCLQQQFKAIAWIE